VFQVSIRERAAVNRAARSPRDPTNDPCGNKRPPRDLGSSPVSPAAAASHYEWRQRMGESAVVFPATTRDMKSQLREFRSAPQYRHRSAT